jgi:hypothetical protein
VGVDFSVGRTRFEDLDLGIRAPATAAAGLSSTSSK